MPVGAAIAGTVVAGGAAIADTRSARRATESAERQREESQAFIESQIKQARGDLFKLFPQAQESRRLGAQAGLDLIAQTVPQQLGAFQQGNVAAQQTAVSGFEQQMNAILGQPIQTDFQPVRIGADFQVPQLPAPVPIGAE